DEGLRVLTREIGDHPAQTGTGRLRDRHVDHLVVRQHEGVRGRGDAVEQGCGGRRHAFVRSGDECGVNVNVYHTWVAESRSMSSGPAPRIVPSASVVTGAVGAASEELQGVRDVGEAVLGRHPVGPAFHGGPLDLDGAAAVAADEVVVVPGAAPAEDLLALV